MSKPPAEIRVGHVTVPIDTALAWVRDYTDAHRNQAHVAPYAYPAYDHFQAGEDPGRITDADLLAPGLLNVGISIRTFYALQRIRERLARPMAHPDLLLPLASIEDSGRIAAMVRPLYDVLDENMRPHGARETVLSKILHRKRPQSIVLHDKWVRACYLGTDSVPHVDARSSADYMAAVTTAIGADIRQQRVAFAALDAATSVPGDLTPVRLLDIVAWRSQGSDIDGGGPVESIAETGSSEAR